MDEKTRDNVAENEIERMEDFRTGIRRVLCTYGKMESMIPILC